MGRGAGEQWPRGRWGPATLPGRQQETLGGESSQARRTLPAYAPPLRGPGPARPLAGTKAIRRTHFRLGHRAPGRGGRRAQIVSGCVNSAFLNISQHFTAHLFSPWIPSSARDIDGRARRSTEVVLNEQSLPVAGSGRVGRPLPEPSQQIRLGKKNTRQSQLCSMPGLSRSNRKSKPFLSGKKQASGTVLIRRGES